MMAGNPIVFILLSPLVISFPGKELLPLGVTNSLPLVISFWGKRICP
jgi:hypothetical protein